MAALTKFIIVLSVFFGTSINAQQLKIVDDEGGEQPTIGPSASITVGPRTFIADEVRRRVLIFTGPELGEPNGIIDYPEGIQSVAKFKIEENQVYVSDHDNRDFVLRELGGISSELEESLEILGQRQEDGTVLLSFSRFEDVSLVPSSPDRSILEWSLLGYRNDQPVVQWIEVDDNLVSSLVGTPADGIVDVSAEVDLSQFEYLVGSPIHLDSSGQLWVISLLDGEWSHEIGTVRAKDRSALDQSHIDFFSGDAAPADQRRIELEKRASYQSTIRDDSASDKAISDYDVIDRAMVSFAAQSNFRLVVEEGLTRDQVVARALMYHAIPYFYRIRNSGDLGSGWKRPTNLIGKTSTWQLGFRYYWSGYMSPIRHQQGLIDGNVVGDIDTGAIIASGIVGCDCSGCVSAWLGIPRHTTSGIGADKDDLFSRISILEARPGDIFNKAGSHVRMLLNKIETASGTRFRVIESAKSCDGVCIRVYSISDLKNYKPLTYKSIKDDG